MVQRIENGYFKFDKQKNTLKHKDMFCIWDDFGFNNTFLYVNP